MKNCLSLAFAASMLATVAVAETGRQTIPDVRVAPLIQSCWGQTTDTGYTSGNPCFNYLTPNNWKCGCTATAMAQVLRYFKAPSAAPAGTYVCAVNGDKRSLDIAVGEYQWDAMPYDTTSGTTEEQRLAIGTLTHDCAVAVHTHFAKSGSFAYSDFVFSILSDTFGYSAKGYIPTDITFAAIKETLFANFDAGLPVLMSLLTEDGVGHQVIADGYGFDGSTPYIHLVFGWPQLHDTCCAWYAFPHVEANGYDFSIIDGITYNIIPASADEMSILSGRVLDATGNPVSNVVVTASWEKAKKTSARSAVVAGTENVTTDEQGCYALMLFGDMSYTVTCNSQTKNVTLPLAVSARCSWSDPLSPVYYTTQTGTLGNSWGNDFILGETPEPEPEPEPEPVDELGPFNPTKAYNGVAPYLGALYDAEGVVRATVSLKVGKASKKGVSKVSGTITWLDGKKYSIKSTNFTVNESGPASVEGIAIKKLGTFSLEVGVNGFRATLNATDGSNYTASTADLSTPLPNGAATFFAIDLPSELAGKPVIEACLPLEQVFTVSGKKWDCGKVASIKYKKINGVYTLTGLDDPKKPNLSGLKLTYTPKTGTFKGSFYIYTDSGTAAKPKVTKTSVSVSGAVVDGIATGLATIKKGGTYSVVIVSSR